MGFFAIIPSFAPRIKLLTCSHSPCDKTIWVSPHHPIDEGTKMKVAAHHEWQTNDNILYYCCGEHNPATDTEQSLWQQ